MKAIQRICASFTVFFMATGLFLSATSGLGQAAGVDQEKKTQAAEASAVKNPAELAIGIPLAGLSDANSAKVREAVSSIEHSIHQCSGCSKTRTEGGQCCGKDMVAKKQRVADSVQVDLVTKQLNVTLHEGHWLRLSDVDGALKEQGVHVDRHKLPLPAHFELTIAGLPTKSSATELEKSLKDGGQIEPLAADFDESAKRLDIRARTKATAATFQKIAEMIGKTNASARVEDFTWAGACSTCRAKGMKQASCPKCWPETGST